MRKYAIPRSMSVEYFLGDHLGSTSITTDANGAKVSEMRYKPWGEVRYSWTAELSTTPAYELAKYTFTGQRDYTADLGLLFYVSRMYDPALGRFIQADSIIPEQSQGVQAWDRFAYTNNNPVRYNDPSGHRVDDGCRTEGCDYHTEPVEGVSREQHERLRAIQEEAELMSTLMHSGEITDVEALARILEFAAPLYGDDVDEFLTDVGIVVGGLNGTTVIGPDDPMSEYYVGYGAFDPDTGTTAFNSIYNPNDDNQVRHFLAGASGSVNYGGLGEFILLAQEPAPEDDALYGQAFAFVDFLQSGVSLRDAGDWVLNNLR